MKRFFPFLGVFAILLFAGAGCVSFSGDSNTKGSAGMFVSANFGDTWQAISSQPTAEGIKSLAGQSVYRIVQDPQDPDTMYWASRSGGLFFTTDQGKTWQQAGAPLNAGFIYAVAVHPQDKCTIYVTTGIRIYKSSDCARTWQEVYRESQQNTQIRSVAFHQFPPYQVFASETNGTLLQSNDAGNSWRVLKRFKQTEILTILPDPYTENVLYFATRKRGLFRTDDGGSTIMALDDGLEEFSGSMTYRFMRYHPTEPNTLFWISKFGILKSVDRGETWEQINLITPPGSANIFGFAVNSKNDKEMVYTATIGGRSTFYRTQDGGQNWTTKKLPSNQTPTALHIHPEKEFVYLGMTIVPEN